MVSNSLDGLLKEDFLYSLIEHGDMSEAEANDCWNSEGEHYIDAVYQHMSDEISHYVNRYKENNNDNR